MREECHIECIITHVFRRGDFFAIHIHQIANRLKSVEGDSYGKEKIMVCELGAKKLIAIVNEEVCVFEIKQKG